MRKPTVPRPLGRGRLKNVLSLDDFETMARRHLPRPLFGYIAGAAETNASLRMNASSFQNYAFKPRVLRDVSGRSMKTELFGKEYAAPFGIAPMGISALMAIEKLDAENHQLRAENDQLRLENTRLKIDN